VRKVPANIKYIKILSFACIGHFLELYDYTVFVVLLSVMSPLFFPADTISGSISIGMLLFGCSLLICAPAAYFWGTYGDKYGRLPMLRKSILMMAFPSLLIALLPTYDDLGMAAALVLMLARFMQTFSAAGEINGAKIFVMEHFGDKYLGRMSGLFSAIGGLGVLFAMFMGWLVSSCDVSWRVPFFIGSSLAIVGVLIRRKVAESPEFIKLMQQPNSTEVATGSTIDMLKNNKFQAIIVISIAAVLGILSYMMHAFMNPFLISLNVSSNLTYQMSIVGLVSCAIISIITGFITDYYAGENRLLIINFIASIILTPLAYKMIFLYTENSYLALLYAAFIILGGLLGMNAALGSVIMYKLFAPSSRCRGIIICYSIGMAIFGGFTPLVLQMLSKVGFYFPAMLVSALIFIALILFKINMEKIDALS